MPQPPDPKGVFLNIPYDEEFRPLYLAYIVGLASIGLTPHLASEVTSSDRRLDRIIQLVQSCRYSIHDLSRVEVPATADAVPRFNMPLELGIAIAVKHLRPKKHDWFVFESAQHRLQRSASDLNGTDPQIHGGTPEGILSQLANVFRPNDPAAAHRISVPEMLETYRLIEDLLPLLLKRNGTLTLYDKNVFNELYISAYIFG